jgi:uncharacterized protein
VPEYLAPGVYVEEVSFRAPVIADVPTARTVFLGTTWRGPSTGPVRICSWGEFEDRFGGFARPPGDRRRSGELDPRDRVAASVLAFFANGGQVAVVRRLVGERGAAPDGAAYLAASAELEADPSSDVDTVVTPGLVWDAEGRETLRPLVERCERSGDRILLVDLPVSLDPADERAIRHLELPTSSYAVAYHPWTRVADPYEGPATPRTVQVAPSGAVAGVWARTDARRGVWKAPAGLEATVVGVRSLDQVVDEPQLGPLAELGINALRVLPSHGPLVWGARTLASRTDPEWRYVPVRRTAIALTRALRRGTWWVTTRENDAQLWSELQARVEAHLDGWFRAGAFQGATPSEAFFVRCGPGSSMTQADVAAGRVVILVGFAPLKPAEFIVLRIARTARATDGSGLPT